MKKLRIIMNEKKKNKEIDDMINKNNNSSYYVDKDEINEFYMTQINWGLSYISGRYGSPSSAWNHSQSKGWY